MLCPVCGGAELIKGADRLVPFEYLGCETMLELKADVCPLCGESILNGERWDEAERQMKAFREEVDRNPPQDWPWPDWAEEALARRKSLGLTQKEAGEIFGGGINAFSRYERGVCRPPLSLMILLRLMEKRPELLEEARVLSQAGRRKLPGREGAAQ